jgi:predicted transcriptional regulator
VATPKQTLVRLLQQQPDDSSHEELVRELAFSLMVDRGLADSDARRVVSDDEMAHRIRQWRR